MNHTVACAEINSRAPLWALNHEVMREVGGQAN
jgi:hypothetical protein